MTMELDDLYEPIPSIECKGLCYGSCGPIEMSQLERKRVSATGVTIKPAIEVLQQAVKTGQTDNLNCPALTPLGKCSVYEQRPTVCRLWGVEEDLPTNFGCKPEDGYLTREEGLKILGMSLEIA